MWTLYGRWLPNDPRGSTSRQIHQQSLTDFGELHFGRKQVQPAGREIREFYQQAEAVLKYPAPLFAPMEFDQVADAIGTAVTESNYTCYAAAMMPDHVHMLIRKHRDSAEQMIETIQSLSRKRLYELGVRAQGHPVWTRGGWKVFVDHPDDVHRTIRYIEQNPIKWKLPAQNWEFVTAYDIWPLHEGHSPKSPYARALKSVGRYSN